MGPVRTPPKVERTVTLGLADGTTAVELFTDSFHLPLVPGAAVPSRTTPWVLVTSMRIWLPWGREVVPSKSQE
ncbi:hypothetical protein D3C80_2080370 [compost metagenome]